jgi:uncharacterized protein (DUF2384 family)
MTDLQAFTAIVGTIALLLVQAAVAGEVVGWVLGGEEERRRGREMTNEERIKNRKAAIDAMSREEMARLWRFAPSGHWAFKHDEVGDYFQTRFKSLGGFNAAISKEIGWDP